MTPEDWSYGCFEPLFDMDRPDYHTTSYLTLLNLFDHGAQAVRLVATCLERCDDARQEIGRLIVHPEGWRPQLVGCAALLAAGSDDRPVDSLMQALCSYSWVSPQLLVTTSLVDPPDWIARASKSLEESLDSKGAAALVALADSASPSLIERAAGDIDDGAGIALRWKRDIARAFDDAGLRRNWPSGEGDTVAPCS